jgi:hypothetical protein
MNIQHTQDGRIILGDPNTKCTSCGATAAVKYASNGKAEVWHAPTDCCEYAILRERRFARLAQEEHDRNQRRYGQ